MIISVLDSQEQTNDLHTTNRNMWIFVCLFVWLQQSPQSVVANRYLTSDWWWHEWVDTVTQERSRLESVSVLNQLITLNQSLFFAWALVPALCSGWSFTRAPGIHIPKESGMFGFRLHPSPWHPYTQRVWNVWVKASPQPLASIYPKSLECLG